MSVVVEKNVVADITSWIARNTPSNLVELRKSAFEEFQKTGLPAHKSEEFKFTPITREIEKNIDFSVTNRSSTLSPEKVFIPGIDANILVFINGVFSKEHSSIISSSDEITILPMEEAVSKQSQLINTHLGKYADFTAEGLTAWNTAAWNTGVFIHVGKNIAVEKPVVIYYVNDTQSDQVISLVRNLFIIEKSSTVTVVEKFDSIGTANHFTNCVTEAVIDEHGELNLYSIQNDPGKQYHYNLKQIQQAVSSRVNTFTFTLNGNLVRNNLHLSLDGEGIESHMYGLYLLGGNTLADNHTVVDHKKPNSFSNELYKGIMDDSSKGVFNGKIFVRPQAQKTNAFQANRNILLTDKASVNTKPQLEIWADDVKCSHGCTSGQLDEEALFYLQSRGLKKETARAMMLYAFAGELLQQVKHPVLREYLDQIVSERLHKNF
jgi:Fe-S cluster assembly protein SufD